MSNTVIKQEWEEFPVSVDFTSEMEDGETISLGDSLAIVDNATVDNPIIKTDSLSVVGTKLQVTVYGGVAGGRYNINMRAYISEDKKIEDDIVLVIK